MSYLTQDEIASNATMQHRVAQAAAQEGVSSIGQPSGPGMPPNGMDPDQWAFGFRRTWSSAPGWDEAWEYAKLTHENEPDFDPGADVAVITDSMILSQVQAMLNPPA
jgi:hypothetical protein